MFGSDSGQDNMAQGAVMGVLPEAGETAHQQTVDPGDKKQQQMANNQPLSLTLSSTLVVICRKQLVQVMCLGSLSNPLSGSSIIIFQIGL